MMGNYNRDSLLCNEGADVDLLKNLLTREEFLSRYVAEPAVCDGKLSSKSLEDEHALKGYNICVEDIRLQEFRRLETPPNPGDARNIKQVYLDNSANSLYPEGLVEAIMLDLKTNIYSNPHSHSPSANKTQQKVEEVRNQVLDFFEADHEEYTVIFTQNATKALQIVAENFPWSQDSTTGSSKFFCTHNAHTSLLGIRSTAINHGATFVPIQLSDDTDPILDALSYAETISSEVSRRLQPDSENSPFHLFAYPGQCNFTGQKYRQKLPLNKGPGSGNIMFLLDGASLASTSPISLRSTKNSKHETPPHFLAVSFYKIFGLPTGLGALIAKREALGVLSPQKSYFGGGSVSSISFSENWFEPHTSVTRRFEDGTLNFLDIIGLGIAINYHHRLYGSMSVICNHTKSLTHYIYSSMSNMRHFNGSPVFVFYPPRPKGGAEIEFWGPIISFNILRTDSSVVGPAIAHRVMAAAGFHIRSGTFCNPGGLALHLASHSKDSSVKSKLAVHRCGEEKDLDESGVPLGALRISLGAYSTWQDARAWLAFLIDGFVARSTISIDIQDKATPSLASMTIYPIKSCRGFRPSNPWPLVPGGLQYDRVWMLIASDSKGDNFVLNQKRIPKMALITPTIQDGKLIISAPGMTNHLDIPLTDAETGPEVKVRLMGRKSTAKCYSKLEIDEWFTSFLGISCRLARQAESESPELHLANEAPFLLINEASLQQLSFQIPALSYTDSNLRGLESAFRANFMISGSLAPYAEDEACLVQMGSQFFKVLGKCRRCQMVNICQNTANILPEPYLTLSKYRAERVSHFSI
ncbi:hypothetical protein DSO57_1034702 [Entomophthora muscae]|uniref:Uncharacterized protein n=1 Tax=Entomophthora muscae TaxID=34485 RepID=A0ACC2TYB6_9FUNG|nr:hypothetical protein DSO57_1034702 [Entomophthora muscae]